MLFALLTWLAGAACVLASVCVAYLGAVANIAPTTPRNLRTPRMKFGFLRGLRRPDLLGRERAALRRNIDSMADLLAKRLAHVNELQKVAYGKAALLADAERLLRESQANNDRLTAALHAETEALRSACRDLNLARRRVGDLSAEVDVLKADLAEVARHRDDARAEWEFARAERDTACAQALKLAAQRDALRDEADRLRSFHEALAARVAAQSQLLTKSATAPGTDAGRRIAELEAALAPFARPLETGWDDGSLPAAAPYPVALGDLRAAARTLAGTPEGNVSARALRICECDREGTAGPETS